MASHKFSAAIVVVSLLFFSTLTSACGKCKPAPKPSPSPQEKPSCSKDVLKLGVCADVLGLVHVVVGTPPTSNCCALIKGLVDLEAAVCLCTALKANVLGIQLDIPVALSLILSQCQKTIPPGFKCA